MRCFIFFAAVSGLAQSVWFEPNYGQVHSSVQFVARSGGGYAYFGCNRMAVRDEDMDLRGANRSAEIEFDEPADGISSYFIGHTEKEWHTVIPDYERVRVQGCLFGNRPYLLKGSGRDIEYDPMKQRVNHSLRPQALTSGP